MLSKSRKLIVIILIIFVALPGAALAQGMGGGGHGHGGHHGGGHHGGNGDHNGGGCNQDSLVIVELSGAVVIDSVTWGFPMDSTGGCGNWDSTFAWGHGHGNNAGHHHATHQAAHANSMYNAQREREEDSFRTVYFLDIDADGIADYVLNFGPHWYNPEDSTLTRPEAGDEITVSGALIEEAPRWDMDVVVVTILNGAEWRELGMGHGGGMIPHGIINNPVIGYHENSPNPFNPTTIISVELLKDTELNVSIYDLKGRQITNLANQAFSAGNYHFIWDGTSQSGLSVPSGVYIYTIQTGNNLISSRITMLK